MKNLKDFSSFQEWHKCQTYSFLVFTKYLALVFLNCSCCKRWWLLSPYVQRCELWSQSPMSSSTSALLKWAILEQAPFLHTVDSLWWGCACEVCMEGFLSHYQPAQGVVCNFARGFWSEKWRASALAYIYIEFIYFWKPVENLFPLDTRDLTGHFEWILKLRFICTTFLQLHQVKEKVTFMVVCQVYEPYRKQVPI